MDLVTWMKLANLPKLSFGECYRADKAAKTRSVRAEQDGLIAGEIKCADGVGIIVDV